MRNEQIPLNKLVLSPANVRKTGADVGLNELAASIEAHGLLQNLVVRPGANGKFEVEAGGRRFRALQRLAKAKRITKDAPVACNVLEEGDAAEISLAENIVRLPMHPADQYEAFKALADRGKGPEEIAARFGCSTLVIQQRLRLAGVSPALLNAYRSAEMTLDQLMAFTVSGDHAAQEKAWADLPEWNRHPSTIRRVLTNAHVEASDRRARFVGLDAYAAAGGAVLRDLFQVEHEGYLTDPALLDRLAAEKLEREAEALRAEGWKWVEIEPEIDHRRIGSMARLSPGRQPPSAEAQAEIDRLTTAYEALIEEHGEDLPDAVAAELAQLSDEIDALSEGAVVWEPADIARSGVVLGIGYNGGVAIEGGLLRAEDAADGATPRGRTGAAKKKRETREDGPFPLPDRVVENLTAHRTAGLRAALADCPGAALAAVAHALALPLFYLYGAESCLRLRTERGQSETSVDGIAEAPATQALAVRHDRWRALLPEQAEGLWDWLMTQDQSVQLDLLAHCAACALDAVQRPREEPASGRLVHADQLARAVTLDMAPWWQATAASYLGHVSKARILEAVGEGVSPEAAENLRKLKKDALVAHAEERLAGTGWLPAILRTPALP